MIFLVVAAVSAAAAVLGAGRAPARRVGRARLRSVAGRGHPGPSARAGPASGVGSGVGSGRRGGFRRSRAVPEAPITVGLLLDLVAEVISSGSAPPHALAVLGQSLERCGDPAARPVLLLAERLTDPRLAAPSVAASGPGAGPRRSAGAAEGSAAGTGAGREAAEALASALALSRSTGAGPVTLIRTAAEENRRQSHARQVQAAQRLGVLVLLPTGLCLLPAFVLLTVVPLVIDLVLG